MKNTLPVFPQKPRKYGVRCLCILLLLVLLPLCAVAEYPQYEPWDCPNCDQIGNTGNFCPNCAAARPVPQEAPDYEYNDSLTQIPGETDWVLVDVLRIDGSAFIKDKKDKYLYAPEKAIDEDDTTCWQFTAKNDPWLCLTIEGQAIDGIWFKNGFRAVSSKGKDQYPLYARLKEVTVVIVYRDDNIPHDTMTFTLTDENTGGWEKIDTGRRENVDLVWIYVNSIYKGSSKAKNACLSEVMLVQHTPSEYAKPSWRHSGE